MLAGEQSAVLHSRKLDCPLQTAIAELFSGTMPVALQAIPAAIRMLACMKMRYESSKSSRADQRVEVGPQGSQRQHRLEESLNDAEPEALDW